MNYLSRPRLPRILARPNRCHRLPKSLAALGPSFALYMGEYGDCYADFDKARRLAGELVPMRDDTQPGQ